MDIFQYVIRANEHAIGKPREWLVLERHAPGEPVEVLPRQLRVVDFGRTGEAAARPPTAAGRRGGASETGDLGRPVESGEEEASAAALERDVGMTRDIPEARLERELAAGDDRQVGARALLLSGILRP